MSEPQVHEPSDSVEPGLQAERQRRVEELADEYLEHLLSGATPDRQALLAAHPEFADLLEPRLALVELMHRVARAPRPADGETASLPPAAERALRMKCPHCGNAIQLVATDNAEVTCGSCGSSFHVDPHSTKSYSPAALPRSIGKFEVLEQLGRGAFGTVYKARDPQLQRLVAVKVPRTGSFATPEEEERFLREARAAAQLSHPGIVPVLEIAHDRGLPYIVSEYVEGLTLADVLTGRRPGFREAAELVAAVADALDCAHRRQIVHRDIKPSNLLIDAAGRPHVTDFGLARRGESEITVTLDGQILGTPAYMAPEQAAGDQQRVDARSDVYSLGVVLYELLTGELPFRGNQRMLLHQVLHDEPRLPRSLNDRVPRDLETICLKAMAKVPNRRYASALELADDLRRFLNGEPIRARPVGRTEKLSRWARRNPVVASLTAAVALLLLTATAVAVSFALYQRQANRDLSDEKDKVERSQREAERRAASLAVDLDLKHCEDGEIEYGVLRLARTLGNLPSHATDLRQGVEMNLLAWAQVKVVRGMDSNDVRPLGPTFQYDGAETTYELSPDGLTVLTGGADGTARLWDSFTGEVRATSRGHRGKIASVGFSQNGRVAMTVGEDRIVRLWEASNGEIRGATAEHPKKIGKALLSPDGKRLLTIYFDMKRVTLWDTATGQRISDLAGHVGQVNDAAFSPDGQTVLTGGVDKTARLWSAANGRASELILGHTGVVEMVAFSPEGDVATTLSENGPRFDRFTSSAVRWWDVPRSRQIGPPCASTSINCDLRCLNRHVAAADCVGLVWTNSALYVRGMENAIEIPVYSPSDNCRADDDSFFDAQGRAYDRHSGKRRDAPLGRKFSPELARFATSGKFIVLQEGLIDLAAEKAIGKREYFQSRQDTRYVSGRQSFFALQWPSPRYMPITRVPLDAEVARLFAEVVTCHELDPDGTPRLLDEATWDERRKQLARRLDEHPAPSLISRLASDPWYWLRRQVDRAETKEKKFKYLDRLIAVEPTWQNYNQRALAHKGEKHWAEAARDTLEAGRRAGGGYWLQPNRDDLRTLPRPLIQPTTGTPEEYQLGLRLAEKLSGAMPENRDLRILLAIALYRVGRYADALSVLELWQREWEQAIVSKVGQFFLLGWRVALLDESRIVHWDVVQAMAFLAMTHHRLGHRDRAQAALAHLRTLEDFGFGMGVPWAHRPEFRDLLREAETFIEGKPQPGK